VRPWQNGSTGLIIAAQNGHEAVVRLLIERKAEVNAAETVPPTHALAAVAC
jgi:ankyrin repeat protein